MDASTFFIAFATLYASYLIVELGLDALNIRHLRKNRERIPELFANVFSFSDYQKSMDYTKSKGAFHMVSLVWQAGFFWLLVMTSAFHQIDHVFSLVISWEPLRAIAYPFAIGLLFFLVGLPLTLFFQFVIEERFGFNKTTFSLFLRDQLKGGLIAVVLGVPLLFILFWLVEAFGTYWWLAGWLAFMLFQVFIAAIFPTLLVPLFFRMTPLSDGELKDRIAALAKQLNFEMAGIYTIDGSKRSTHSNAFFAGLGKTRRIVLFDTLINTHSSDEIIAVVAHEMGHYKKKHVQRSLLLSSFTAFLAFWILAQCLKSPAFFKAFGVPNPSVHVGFVLFALFISLLTFPLGPLFKYFSRQHEYEADTFSVQITHDKEGMISALVKLSQHNLSNLTPHPWYSFFHYTHPTAIERAAAISKQF